MVIHNSSIVKNIKAPKAESFSVYDSSHLYVDARYNYWESNGKKGVPDDSPFNLGDDLYLSH